MAQIYIPVAGINASQLSDNFGAARSGGRSHKGIDIFAKEGTAVVAARGGTVVRAGDSGGLGGLRVWVRDDDGRFHYYAHLNSVSVREGQRVEGGQQLGGVGNTGTEAVRTPHHLHYSVNSSSSRETGEINPYRYLTGAAAIQPTDSTEAMARRRQRREVGVPELGSDEEFYAAQEAKQREFVEGRQMATSTMASIMSSISQKASGLGGKVLDTRALFGDIHQRDDQPTADEDTGHVSPVGRII